MIQGTKKWHQWRDKGIGGSDANVIWANAYGKSPERLIYEKAGLVEPKVVDNFASNMGKKYEPDIIKEASKYAELNFEPKCVEHPLVPWMRASLDGWSGTPVIAEAKLSGQQLIQQTRFGIMPRIHQGQILHNMMCAQAEICVYAVFSIETGDYAVTTFNLYDYEEEACRLILAEHIVWEAIQSVKDTYDLDAPTEENRYIAGLELSKIAKEIMADAKADLMKVIGERTEGRIGRLQFKQVTTKGRLDLDFLAREEGVSLDLYRKEPTVSMRFTVKNEESQ